MSFRTQQLSFLDSSPSTDDVDLDINRHSGERPVAYTGIYGMHKYWSKKPHNLVARYIERFSKCGEVVLDPFCGSGVAAIESVRLNRRVVAIDINPIAVLCSQMGLEHIDIKSLKKTFDSLRREVEVEIDKLYYTACPECENPHAIATHTIWHHEQPKEIWVSCKLCKTIKAVKTPSSRDKELSLKQSRFPDWYPAEELIENNRINAKAGTRICDLFTPRALSGLSFLLNKIRLIEDGKIRRVMEFCFSAMLPQTSKMVFVIRRRGKFNGKPENDKAEVGSWVIGYWIPSEHFEIHAWRCFKNRFQRIIKGKQEVNLIIPSTAMACSSFEELRHKNEGYWINQGTATNLLIPDESIDYIFTDPPHGNRLPYLELSLLWNSWLNLNFEWENEIVIQFNRSQNQLESLILDYLSGCDNGAETYAIMNHVLVNSISTGTVFKVSGIIETIERLALFRNGRWYLKLM